MRCVRGVFAAILATGFVATEAQATCCLRPVTNDDICRVTSWYQRYLGRNVDPVGMGTWTTELRHGRNAEAGILGSDEYFCRHGGTPDGFVVGLYFDVLGRPPEMCEVQNWVRRLGALKCNRVRVAEEFLRASCRELAQRPAAPPIILGPPPVIQGPPPAFAPGPFPTQPPPGALLSPPKYSP